MAEPPVFFAYTGGRQLGPLRFAEMADLAARGILQPDDLAWKSGTPEWVAASQLLAFPGRKPPSGVFESLAIAPKRSHAEEDVPVALATPISAASSGARQSTDSALPQKWPRVSLARVSDDPGISLVETGTAGGAGEAAKGAGAVPGDPALESGHRLARLLPLRRLNDAAVLGSPITWALVFFGLGPLFVWAVAADPLLRIRLFYFGCGVLWVVFFYAAFRTESATSRTVLAVFFGSALFAALYSGLLAGWPPVATLAAWAAPGQSFPLRFLAGLGGAALVQEAGKLAILFLVARSMRAIEGVPDGLFHGLIAGAAFGLCATLFTTWPPEQAGEGILRSGGEGLSTAVYAAFLGRTFRSVTLPFLHAVWTGIAATFLARGIVPATGKAAPGRAALGLGLAVLLHALYDSLTTPRAAFLAFLAAATALFLLLALKREAEEEPILTALR